MSEVTNMLLVGIGIPVLGVTIIIVTYILKTWWVKYKQLKMQDEQMRLEMKIMQDQANELTIESFSHSLSHGQIESVLEEVKTLKEELARLRADVAAMKGDSLSGPGSPPQRNMENE